MRKISKENSKFDSLPKVSHFDGKSQPEFKCAYCRLPAHASVMKEDDQCIPCNKEITIITTENLIGRYSLPALLLAVTIWFWEPFAQFQIMIPFLVVIIFFPLISGNWLIRKRIYSGLEPKDTISHSLKFYRLNKERPNISEKIYLNRALDLLDMKLNLDKNLYPILQYYVVEYFILSNETKDEDYFERIANAFEMDEIELLRKLIENTNIDKAFGFEKGKGFLPDIWPYIHDNEELTNQVLDIVNVAVLDLENATQTQKQFFLEDLYLIENELLDYIEKTDAYQEIKLALEGFEPETPPRNFMESLTKKAAENQRLIQEREFQKQQNAKVQSTGLENENIENE